MVQCPLLCGRMASSLTTYAGSPVRGSRTSNSSTAITPVTPSSPAMRSAASVARAARSSVEAGRGGEHLGADAVGLHRLHDRPGGGLAGRAAGDEHGELADEVDPLLGEQPSASSPPAAACRPRRPASPRPRRRTRRPHALAVVAAAGRLDAPPASRPRRRRPATRRRSPTGAHRGHGDADVGEPLAHGQLVLGEARARRAGVQRDAVGLQRARGRPAGTCSWSNVTTSQRPGEGAHGLDVGVAPDRRRRDDQGGRGVRRPRPARRG